MIARLFSLFSRFRSDERGAFLVIFGVAGVVLIALSGAVVDYTSVQQARTRAQVALDAAALALQPQIYTKTAEQLRLLAEPLLLERLGEGARWSVCKDAKTKPPCAQVTTVVTDTVNGVITLNASIDVPLYFVALVGIDHMKATMLSEASRKKLNLEVAMVLDNSNSMNNLSRMDNLKKAVTCAVNVLFNADCASSATVSENNLVSIGIVPFTMLVNVGTNNASAKWMDRTGVGASNITTNNFDNDDNNSNSFAGPIDRIALFNSMKGVSWGGCVEGRTPPYDTDDTPPTNASTMFTPLFAPDEPDAGFSNSYIDDRGGTCPLTNTCTWTEVKTKCSNYNSCDTTTNSYYKEPDKTTSSASCLGSLTLSTDSGTGTYTGTGSNRTYTRTRYYTNPRVMQERMCKYAGATPTGISQANAHGPNSDCPVNPILPLTGVKANVAAAIKLLSPQGGTNIHAGTEWGFRVLSPGEPFTEGKAYSQETSKVMIIMTDGENTAYQTSNMNNSTYYSHYGYPWNKRMGTATSTGAELVTEMNARTMKTCENAKKAGITIFTVGLSVDKTDNPAANTTMLTTCSSGSGYAFFPTSSDQLTPVFESIAKQLSPLRIVK